MVNFTAGDYDFAITSGAEFEATKATVEPQSPEAVKWFAHYFGEGVASAEFPKSGLLEFMEAMQKRHGLTVG